VLRLLPLAALCGCSLLTDFDREITGSSDAAPQRNYDAGAHERLQRCRAWCPGVSDCLADDCMVTTEGPARPLFEGVCLTECLDGQFTEAEMNTGVESACRFIQDSSPNICSGWATCQYLCFRIRGESALEKCFGENAECEQDCAAFSEDEWRCAGFALGLTEDDQPPRQAMMRTCTAIETCIDGWPKVLSDRK
jgi:hypothetical protein